MSLLAQVGAYVMLGIIGLILLALVWQFYGGLGPGVRS